MPTESKTKIVFFDMDGVLFDVNDYRSLDKKIAASIWKAVFDSLDILSEHKRLKDAYLSGTFATYMEWTDAACKVLREYGLTKQVFADLIAARSPMLGAKEAIDKLKENGHKTALITGTFHALADRAVQELGIDTSVSHCRLIFGTNDRLSDWKLAPCDFEGKRDYFHAILREEGLSPEQAVYIGDEVNDIPLFGDACRSVAFNCTKQEVKDAADIVVDSRDLRDILPHI